MEISFKFIVDNVHPKKDFTLPVRLRLYQKGRYKDYSLGFSVLKEYWNEKLQQVTPKSDSYLVYNSRISSLKSTLNRFLLIQDENLTRLTLTDVITHLNKHKTDKNIAIEPDILVYGKACIDRLIATGNVGNAIVYSCAINKLKGYAKENNLPFSKITFKFLEDFSHSMLLEGIKINTISNYFRTIRALFNKAVKDGTIEADVYAFKNFKIKSEKTVNRTLSNIELTKMASLELSIGTPIWHYRNLFLVSFCLIGANLSDILTLKASNIIEDRVVFRRRKTHKIYSILIHEDANRILSYYKKETKDGGFLLPFLKNNNNPMLLKKDIQQVIKNCNKYLFRLAQACGINKHVTTYYARYSWANIARGLGYSKDLISEALGHNSTLDNMNKNVMNLIFERHYRMQRKKITNPYYF